MNRVIGLSLTLMASLFTASAHTAAPAAPGPLSIKVIAPSYLTPVDFTLDRKYSCKADASGGDAGMCVFSTDCSQFSKLKCVPVAIRSGKHLVKVAYGRGSLSAWAAVGTVKNSDGSLRNGVECLFSETMGSAQLFLECDDPIRAED